MTDPLDTDEGRALVEAGARSIQAFADGHADDVAEQKASAVIRAVLAATNEHGESIVVLRSRLERVYTVQSIEGGIASVPMNTILWALPDNTEGHDG